MTNFSTLEAEPSTFEIRPSVEVCAKFEAKEEAGYKYQATFSFPEIESYEEKFKFLQAQDDGFKFKGLELKPGQKNQTATFYVKNVDACRDLLSQVQGLPKGDVHFNPPRAIALLNAQQIMPTASLAK